MMKRRTPPKRSSVGDVTATTDWQKQRKRVRDTLMSIGEECRKCVKSASQGRSDSVTAVAAISDLKELKHSVLHAMWVASKYTQQDLTYVADPGHMLYLARRVHAIGARHGLHAMDSGMIKGDKCVLTATLSDAMFYLDFEVGEAHTSVQFVRTDPDGSEHADVELSSDLTSSVRRDPSLRELDDRLACIFRLATSPKPVRDYVAKAVDSLGQMCSAISPECRVRRLSHQVLLRCCRAAPPSADPEAGVWVALPLDDLITKAEQPATPIRVLLEVPMLVSPNHVTALPGAPTTSEVAATRSVHKTTIQVSKHSYFGVELQLELEREEECRLLRSITIDDLDQIPALLQVLRKQACHNSLWESCLDSGDKNGRPRPGLSREKHTVEARAEDGSIRFQFVDPRTEHLACCKVHVSQVETGDVPQLSVESSQTARWDRDDIIAHLCKSLSVPVSFCFALSGSARAK